MVIAVAFIMNVFIVSLFQAKKGCHQLNRPSITFLVLFYIRRRSRIFPPSQLTWRQIIVRRWKKNSIKLAPSKMMEDLHVCRPVPEQKRLYKKGCGDGDATLPPEQQHHTPLMRIKSHHGTNEANCSQVHRRQGPKVSACNICSTDRGIPETGNRSASKIPSSCATSATSSTKCSSR